MASTVLSPPPLNLPTFSSSSANYTATIKNKTTASAAASNSRYWWRWRRRASSVIAKASEKDDDTPAFNPLSFVTDNPSSRSAIQLPESPAEDGNVGQMLYRIEDKGKDFGSYIKSGGFRWFVRETGSPESGCGTIVFLHGAPTQSYSYRVVMSEMADAGFHCFAPDWIGFGFSEKPQAGYGFDYTEKEFHVEFDNLIDVLGIKSPFSLVVQGFLVGSYGLTWALKNPSRISKLAILNSPLTVSSPVPGLFQQLRIPLFGEFTCQNAIMAERFIEAGSPYVLKLEKADVYRLPYLESSGPGFAESNYVVYFVTLKNVDTYGQLSQRYKFPTSWALLEAAKKANFKDISSQIAAGFASGSWDKPILVAWGTADKYLPQSVAEEFQKGNPSNVKLKLIEGAGHMPQEDWPEKIVDALRVFF